MLNKAYNPQESEERIYALWEEKKLFQPQPGKKQYCIIMPPPNITGKLHMGHAMYVIQDILVRFHRMLGYETLYLPGTDHAGIATQNVVEKELKKQGLSRHDIGRKQFVEKVWEWKKTYGATITKQLRTLGMSCDWQRERFTLDNHSAHAVRTAFVQLYNQGLIYQGEYIVHWCPRCQSVLADDEITHQKQQSFLWFIRYPFAEGKGKIIVATTRPETMLGDTAVAVHPADVRYKNSIGKTIRLPLLGRKIPVIADKMVDPKFGTGAVKVTPAHDFNDYELGKRHTLPSITVIGFDNIITKEAHEFSGLTVAQARQNVEQALAEKGFLEKKVPYEHTVSTCYRCQTVVEPLISKQWFVKTKTLAQPAIQAVKQGTIKFIPKRFNKIYFQWLENIRDWCISRQLWWGHQIPVYSCTCGNTFAAVETPKHCPQCHSKKIKQDDDVLDTWFSSALWPFSTLGWPQNKTKDLLTFYPTSVLETGYDIIFFWVARMVMLGLACTKKVPFREVFLHGLVRDEQGRKMSKSIGNVLDPLDIISEYGSDALRYSLIAAVSPGNDLNFSIPKTQGYKHFANKIWNASRFVVSHCENLTIKKPSLRSSYTLAQRWIISRFHHIVATTTKNLQAYHLSEAALVLYDFFWHEFCDWYVEIAKLELQADKKTHTNTKQILLYILSNSLKLLHPLMPFLTETIWQEMPQKTTPFLITTPWPQPGAVDKKALADFRHIIDIVTALRTIRAQFHINPAQKLNALCITKTPLPDYWLRYLETLAALAKITQEKTLKKTPSHALKIIVGTTNIYLFVGTDFDFSREQQRIKDELAKLQLFQKNLQKELTNQAFITKAPQHIVAGKKQALVETKQTVATLQKQLLILEYAQR